MSIDKLPAEILYIIFGKLTELNDIVNCFKVCERWSYLIGERTRKVKYLIRNTWPYGKKDSSKDRVYHGRTEPFDGSVLHKVFPNLRIADISPPLRTRKKYEDIAHLVSELLRNGKNIKGLIQVPFIEYMDILQYGTNLEMLCIRRIPRDIQISEINRKVKQIYTCSHPVAMSAFSKFMNFTPSLERIQAKIFYDKQDAGYDGPQLENVKIVELDLRPNLVSGPLLFGLDLLDSCPALESAYVFATVSAIIFHNSTKNENLQDLVVEFIAAVHWNDLRELLSKYPNLKHLALRNNQTLRDENIYHIITTLPKLELLDVRNSHLVTERAAYFVQDYCQRHGRKIKFYFKKEDGKQIEKDWPHLSTRIEIVSRGFNFMKHCFLKDINDLPYFLDPMDD